MALLPIRKVRLGPGSRQPKDDPSFAAWLKKELWALLGKLSSTLDWATDFLGKVQVDATDEPGNLETKLVDSATVGWTKGGTAGARTFSAAVIGSLDDHLVKSSATDATAVGGLVEKTDQAGAVTLSEVTVSGQKKLRVSSPVLWVTSTPAVHDDDEAVFLCDEYPTTTTVCYNTGHTAGNLAFGTGTVKQGAGGLRESRCIHMLTDARMHSEVNKWQYQVFTVHFWLFMETLPLSTEPIFGVTKMSNQTAYTTPYYSVGLALNSTNLTARVLKTVSPREYVELSAPPPPYTYDVVPLVNQFLLHRWNHLALSWDGTYLILYVDGHEYSRSAAQTGVTIQYHNNGEWVVGHPFGVTSASKFAIQDFRINSTALSADYILDIYRRGLSRLDRAPNLYY